MWARRDQHTVVARGAAALRQRFTAYNKMLKQVHTFKYSLVKPSDSPNPVATLP